MPTVEIPDHLFAWLTARAAVERARLAAAGTEQPYTADDVADDVISAAIPQLEYQALIASNAAANDDDIPF